jgi:predicted acylesterase/phospholipase RssA
MSTTAPLHRRRRHGAHLEQSDRRALERAGWRTLLTYRENHVRAWDGTLLAVTPVWVAEAERAGRPSAVVQAQAPSIDEVWRALRVAVEQRASIEPAA